MFNEINQSTFTSVTQNEQNLLSKRFNSDFDIRDLIEAQLYRETKLAEEKKSSSILSITLDKLIKALVPLK